MLEMRIQTSRRRFASPSDLPSVLGAVRAKEELGQMVEYLIAQIDKIEGDPDLECNGDPEPDGDAQGDIAWIEWSSRAGRHHGAHETMAYRHMYGLMREDDEDDDPAEADDDDTGVDDLSHDEDFDREGTPDHNAPIPRYTLAQLEPLEWSLADDRRAFRPHRDRIRATRCEKSAQWRGWPPQEYVLTSERPRVVFPNPN